MPRLCPRCNNSMDGASRCSNCGYRVRSVLGRRGEANRPAGEIAASWQQTAWGKTIIGLVVAQGLWYTLIMLARTVVSATGNDVGGWMSSMAGLLVMQVMQLVSLLVGGMLAGAGQRRGAFYGTIVGVYNAILFIVFYIVFLNNQMAPLALFAMLLLQVVFGTLGGFLGVQIWRPIQALAPLDEEGKTAGVEKMLAAAAKQQKAPILAGPINWIRVLLGTAVAVAGTLAHQIYRILVEFKMEGAVPLTRTQSQFLTWEISALAMFIGGAISGSNSHNGLKQGLFVGILSSVSLIGGFIYQGDTTPTDTASFLFTYFGIEQSGLVHKIILTVLAVMPLSTAGGWFGGQLLPPLIVPPRRKRMLPTMS